MKLKKGDKLYLPSQYYLSRGSDDFEGGLATVDLIIIAPDLPENHRNKTMVSFLENPTTSYNYYYLLENQDKWSKEYAGRVAHPNPDIDQPWIQKGDIVNGKEWKGSDVW